MNMQKYAKKGKRQNKKAKNIAVEANCCRRILYGKKTANYSTNNCIFRNFVLLNARGIIASCLMTRPTIPHYIIDNGK